LKAAMGGMETPREDLQTRFEASSSLSAKDFDESSKMGVIASIDPLFSSAERIRPSASFSKASRTYSDDDGLYPEPTGNGFAKLKRRLKDIGLL
jgi:hypothetical protein